ncbi:SMP-30/gluconolactonase/LRE family protein [Deminuibacter soli]|uniref:ATP/GTP-binding protein n=1 Tax=Deminuibacter soli TaxID=2291815 RepID=A0A3E1NI18_9BACT|nr:hypothetical protein [Deminuibacter soli]RFM27552.1 hypothetical protein DXN05_12585 [Deminuibacter soli]
MKKQLILLLFCSSLLLQASAQLQPFTTLNDFQYPESITTDGHFLYVANIGAQFAPLAKDGDGFIAQLDMQGKPVKRLVAAGLHAPKGMAIVQGVLYVTDIDTLKGFKLSDGKLVFQLGFAGADVHFLNDITAKDNHTLFVSETAAGKVFEVQLGSKPSFIQINSTVINGANGLTYDAAHKKLYIVSLGAGNTPGEIGVMDMNTRPYAYTTIGSYKGYLDGVALLPGNRLLFTDWVSLEKPVNSTLNILSLNNGTVTTIANGMQGAADLLYIPVSQTAWVPVMAASQLAAFKLP